MVSAGFYGNQGAKAGGVGYAEELSPTLKTAGVPTVMIKCYGFSSMDSNAMKSSNPHSGIYEAETSRTLDQNGGNPNCNQGGALRCKADNDER